MTRTELLASLSAVTDNNAWNTGDEDDPRYIDWSINVNDGARMELGDGDEAASIDMTRAEIVELHKRLTLWLLTN